MGTVTCGLPLLTSTTVSPRLSRVPGAGSCLNTCPSATLLECPAVADQLRGQPVVDHLGSQPLKLGSASAFSLPWLTQMLTVRPPLFGAPIGD